MADTEPDLENFETEPRDVPEFCTIGPPRHAKLEEVAIKVYEVLKRGNQVPFPD